MAVTKQIIVSIEAKNTLSPEAIKAARDVIGVKNAVDQLRRGGEGSDIFGKIREGLGRRSALGETTDLINGGGSRLVGGLTGGADAIKNLAEQAGKLQQEFAAGKVSAGEMTEKLVEGLPIIGSFWQAGQAVRELFTHEAEDLAKANAEAKTLDDVLKSQHETMKVLAEEAKKYGDFMADAAKEIAKSTLPLVDAERIIAEIDAAKKKSDKDTEEKDAIDKAREASKGGIDAARKAFEDARAAESAAQATADSPSDDDDENAALSQNLAAAKANIVAKGAVVQMAIAAEAQAEAKIRQQYADERAVSDKVDSAKEAEESRKAGEQQRAEAERSAKAVADAKAEAAETLDEMDGNHYQVELDGLRKSLADKLESIAHHAKDVEKARGLYDDDSINANGAQEDAEMQAAIDAESLKEAKAAHDEKMRLDDIESEARQRQVDAYKEMAEQAQSLSDGPLQEYLKKMTEINNLNEEGAFATGEYQRAVAKANRELASQGGGGNASPVAADVRRFDRGVDVKPMVDPIMSLAEQQKKQAADIKSGADYTQKIHDLIKNNNSITVNF